MREPTEDMTKFLEKREQSIAEICEMFNVPVSLIGAVTCNEVHQKHSEAFMPRLSQLVNSRKATP